MDPKSVYLGIKKKKWLNLVVVLLVRENREGFSGKKRVLLTLFTVAGNIAAALSGIGLPFGRDIKSDNK